MSDAYRVRHEACPSTCPGVCDMTVYESPRLGECCERVRLENGMTVLLVPKQMTQSYAMLVVRYGAQDTAYLRDGQKIVLPEGVAHFLEHKLFADPDGMDANDRFSAIGAESNAWTTYDKTAYLFSTTEAPDEALAVLLDFVLTPYFTTENVDHERGIIREEIRMGEDNPWQTLSDKTMRAMYTSHPLRTRICGSVESIERIGVEQLYEAYHTFYRPEYMTLVVCGDVTMARVLDAIQPVLAAHPSDAALHCVERVKYPEPPTVSETRVTGVESLSQPLFQIALKDTVLPTDPYERLRRETAMNVLSEVLFSRASRFYNELFEAGKITPSYSYGYSTTDGAAYHALVGEADDPEAVYAAYLATVERARREGLDPADVERYRRVMYAGFVSEFDYPEDVADLLCEAEGNGCTLFESLRAIDEVTYEEVCALLDAFDERATVFTVLYPEESGEDDEMIEEEE